MNIFRAIPVQTVKEACPVGSCPVTTEEAVRLPQGGRVAPACQGMVDPSVSIKVTKGVPHSHAEMEGCAQKRRASRSSTASVPVAGRVNDVSRAARGLRSQHPLARWRTVMAKPEMEFVTRSVTHYRVAGMVATAP